MKYFITILILFLLNSCASESVAVRQQTYEDGMKNLKIGNYRMSAEIFEKLEDTQPFSQDAVNGLIMASYSYYKSKQYEDSIRVINYFIQSNPINENLPYMYYLKSLNYYDRMTSMSKGRDIIENANASLRELIYKYPNTPYAIDARKKLRRTETFLSGNEMTIAKYYLDRQNYIGAMNHYTKVLKTYPNSNFIPEALYRLIEISNILNLKSEAIQYYQLLVDNYKDSNWTKYSTNIIKKYDKN